MRQSRQQAVMARGMAGCGQHDHAPIAEYILVAGNHIDIVRRAVDPAPEGCGVHVGCRLRGGDRLPVSLADQQPGMGKFRQLAGMVEMIMADGDGLDLCFINAQDLELFVYGPVQRRGHRPFAGQRSALDRGRQTGIPEQVIIAMTQQVAAIHQRHFLPGISVGIRKDIEIIHLDGAAVEPRQGKPHLAGFSRHR